MNDLMTKSFLSYVDLKKQAMKDMETEQRDLEMGILNPVDEQNLTQFYTEVAAIKDEMEEITNLLLDLQDLKEETKTTHATKLLRGLRDRINSDMVMVLRKAKVIKLKLELLDKSNVANRSLAVEYKEGTFVDRTRISITNGLRIKLKDMMNDFQSLRDQIVHDHKEGVKRRYFNATGEEATEELVEKIVAGRALVDEVEGQPEFVEENYERSEALKDIQRSLTNLHQVFLDMAVLVDTQGEQINDIEENVARAGAYISGGTNGLHYANQMKKKRGKWVWWVSFVVILILFICLISILVS